MADETNVLVQIRADDDRPIYAQIGDEIRRAIAVGGLEPEDPLPSVRELAGELRVNPNTVSRAYQELEREGLVYVRRGRGTFVSPDARAGDRSREDLLRQVARRALRDARRHGVTAGELADAVRELADGDRDQAGGRTEERSGDPQHTRSQ